MMYEEFIKRVKSEQKPSQVVYRQVIEPVYTYMPKMTKDFCAKMYDELGISVFIGLKDYALKIRDKEEQYRQTMLKAKKEKYDLDKLLGRC